jgi:hypothetical protein
MECDLAARARAQILMHRYPGLQFELELTWQHANERGIAPGDTHLADANSASGSNQRQLAEVAVGPQRERLTAPHRQALPGSTQEWCFLIEADQ